MSKDLTVKEKVIGSCISLLLVFVGPPLVVVFVLGWIKWMVWVCGVISVVIFGL